MTWSELIQHAQQFAPNAEVYLQLHLPVHVCPVHYPVSAITGDGAMVMIHGAEERVEGGGIC